MTPNVQRKIDSQRIGVLVVCLIALACALLLAHEFSPGFMSGDTLYQYRQAMGPTTKMKRKGLELSEEDRMGLLNIVETGKTGASVIARPRSFYGKTYR